MRTAAPIGTALALALCAPCTAQGAPSIRISIAGVRSDADEAVATQLARGLCRPPRVCVPAEKVRRGGKLDFEAVKAQRVDGVLFGTVARSRGRRYLELALLTTSLAPRRTWLLPIDGRGRLTPAGLAALADELDAELAPVPAATPAPAQAQVTTPPPADPHEPTAGAGARALSAVATGPVRVTPVDGAAPPGPGARTPAPAATPPPAATPRPGSRLAAVDLGVDVTRRKLTYDGTGGAPLGYSAQGIVSPGARVEVSPLAGSDRWYAGATAFGAYFHSIGLETEASGVRHDTAFTRLELGAGLRFRPVPSARATILARGSYRTLALEVSPQGAIPGLPDTDLAGPSVGLELEAPVGERWALLAGAAYTWWLRAKELVSDTWFPDGSARGFDASAGLSAGLWRPVSLRLTVDYSQTRYELSGTSGSTITGATDAYLGARAVMRIVF